jgi:hypothetical protein
MLCNIYNDKNIITCFETFRLIDYLQNINKNLLRVVVSLAMTVLISIVTNNAQIFLIEFTSRLF